MTDLHCHILPGMDDGAKDVTVSLELLRKEQQDGVDQIALTSHFNSERTDVETFLARRAAAYTCLCEALKQEPMPFTFKLGAEVYFSPKLCDLDVQALCMQDTAYLLLEFPTTHRPHFIGQTLQSLRSRGVIPLIAHVERYPYVLNDPQLLYEWVAAGAYAQINAGALLDAKLGKKLLKFIDWDLVQVLSTDAHSPDQRPPKLGEAVAMLERKRGGETARRIVHNGDALFADRELNTSAPHQPRKVLGMWV
jgi:protein-tyrosine phosphatase